MTDHDPQPEQHAPDREPAEITEDGGSAAEIDAALRASIGDSSPAPPTSPTPTPVDEDATATSLEDEIASALAGVDLMALAEESAPAPGTRISLQDGRRTRTGRIVLIRDGDVLVEFGPKRQGVCPVSQFTEPPVIGADQEFLVERLDAEGLFVLSVPGAVQKADWGSLEVGQTVEGRVTGVNKGGLEVEVSHHTGFMPAGQIDIRHIPDISVMLGEKISCRVTQLDKKRGRLILSRRAVIEEERAANAGKILAELQPGQRRTVVVTSVQQYGAFADLGGVDGLIHVTELSHERVRDPGDVVKVGDTFDVVVTKIDTSGEQPKIGLSRKAVLSDPRAEIMNTLETGATVAGTVRKIADFGAFLEISEGVEGLLHISEVSHRRIDRIDRELRVGEVVQVKILSIDADRGRISLSKKALEERPASEKGRGRGDDGPSAARAEDPAMAKLRAKFSGDLKGGLG
jgi:ribosomal protein S1